MKKQIYLLAFCLVVLFTVSSCKKDVIEPDQPLTFSTLTVEQQKQSIEQSGIDLMDKMDAINETKAMAAMKSLSSLGSNSQSYVKSFSQLRLNILKNKANALEVFTKQLRTSPFVESEWGTYTWNKSKQDFDFVKGGVNKATLLFPATEASTTNNAEVAIDYSESTVAAPDTDPIQYMPKSGSVVLKVNGQQALIASFNGDYYSDGMPKSITQSLEIDNYKWSFTSTNTEKVITLNYSLTYNAETLLKFEATTSGNTGSISNIENNFNSSDPQNIITSGSVYFQVMNIAVVSKINDFKGFWTEAESLKYSEDKSHSDKVGAIFNKYMDMYGYFVKENKKFADVEMYTTEVNVPDYTKSPVLVYTATTNGNFPSVSVNYTYYSYDFKYNYSTNSYEYVFSFYDYPTKIGYEAQPRFVLSDGSKVAIENFFSSGFDNLITKFEGYQQ